MRKLLDILLVAVVISIAAACSSDERGDFQAVDASGWAYGDTLSFNLNADDSVRHGDIAIVIRHTAAYPYSNIWLEVNYPTADSIATDTVNIALADNLGNWYGRGLGLSFQRADTVIRNITLTSPAAITLRHIMRTDLLSDIEQVGMIFYPDSK